jgi:aryl-phospho-beta-D-glucosidase BglC (GH1 family)
MKTLLLLALIVLKCMADPIRCMNFYGLETEHKGLVCDWSHPPRWYLERLKNYMDINTIRLPFSYEYFKYSDKSKMDEFVRDCRDLNLNVILDYHRTWSNHQGAVPTEGISLDEFTSTWLQVLERYKVFQNVVGVGIFNEIQLNNDFDYANSLHKGVINSIEAVHPDRFLYFVGCPNWSGNCSGMMQEDNGVWNRTYIEVHKYIFSGNSVPADWDISIPYKIPSERWFIGETGWKQQDANQRNWAEGFLTYLEKRDIKNVCAWTIAHSGDTDGWWKDDCETFDWDKASLLNTLWFGSFKRLRGTQ